MQLPFGRPERASEMSHSGGLFRLSGTRVYVVNGYDGSLQTGRYYDICISA